MASEVFATAVISFSVDEGFDPDDAANALQGEMVKIELPMNAIMYGAPPEVEVFLDNIEVVDY